jgi:hypothetical protein
VTDVLTGQGIAGAQVELVPGDEATTMDADGRYALFDLPAGEYRVRASAPGYAREYWDNVAPSEQAAWVNVSRMRPLPASILPSARAARFPGASPRTMA